MNGQSHMRAPNKCFLSLVPWQPQNLKAGRSSLTDIPEHLLKGAWEGLIPTKPTVKTNIIGLRLNSITLKTCFLPTEKKNQSAFFEVLSIQNVSHAELTHAFEMMIPHWVFSTIRQTHSCQVGLLAYPATCEIFLLFENNFQIMRKSQFDYYTPQPPYTSLEAINPRRKVSSLFFCFFFPVLENKPLDFHMLIWDSTIEIAHQY